MFIPTWALLTIGYVIASVALSISAGRESGMLGGLCQGLLWLGLTACTITGLVVYFCAKG